MYVFGVLLVFKLLKSGLQITRLISNHVTFLGSPGIVGYVVVAYFERWILTLGHFPDAFFWPFFWAFFTPVCHAISWTWLMFFLRVFSICIHKKHKSNHYLLFAQFFLIRKWLSSVCKLYTSSVWIKVHIFEMFRSLGQHLW